MKRKLLTAACTALVLAAVLAVTAFAGEATTVSTAEALMDLMKTPALWSESYVLGADIDLTGKSQDPIGNYSVPFSGSFDGAGYTVKGLNIRANGTAGLFGAISGTVKNLTVEGSVTNTFTAQNAETKLDGKYPGTGGVAGVLLSGATLENCVSRVSAVGPGNVGGVVGVVYNFGLDTITVKDCINEGTISSEYGNCGGLIARIYVSSAAEPAVLVSGCENRADLTLTSEDRNRLGGIAGYIRSEAGTVLVEHCVNNGDLLATNSSASGTNMPYVGGIAARVEMVTDASSAVSFAKCVNNGAIESPTCSGGVVSYFDRAPTCTDKAISISECVNTGAVKGTRFAGGVVAYTNCRNTSGTSEMLNCLNTGTVTNESCGAGILGRQYGISVKNCYNAGAVVATTGFGAIVGKAEGQIYCETDNAYYLATTSTKDIGTSSDLCVKLNVQALSADAAAKQESFDGFDFDLIWKMENGAPALQLREGTSVGTGDTVTESPFKATRTYEEQFTDVPTTAWFHKFVKTAYEYALANGTGTTKFSPDNKFTVAQALTAAANIHKAYYAKEVRAAQSGEVWYTPYVNYCIDNGIIPYGLFTNYDKNITRGEMAIVFANILPDSEYTAVRGGTNPDVTLDMACYNAVAKLYQAGIVGGDAGTGNYRPNDEIVRSEACVIFTRIAVANERTK